MPTFKKSQINSLTINLKELKKKSKLNPKKEEENNKYFRRGKQKRD